MTDFQRFAFMHCRKATFRNRHLWDGPNSRSNPGLTEIIVQRDSDFDERFARHLLSQTSESVALTFEYLVILSIMVRSFRHTAREHSMICMLGGRTPSLGPLGTVNILSAFLFRLARLFDSKVDLMLMINCKQSCGLYGSSSKEFLSLVLSLLW